MERTYSFGERKNLVGILSNPENRSEEQCHPLIMILNAGFVHRCGPFRMNTELANTLSKSGFTVFRFDLAGIGDSEKPAEDSRSYKKRNLDDVGEAIEFLTSKTDIEKIIIIGLCTGADLAHRALVKYSQITSAVLMDGYGYPTTRFHVNRYSPVIMTPTRLLRALNKLSKKLIFSKKENNEYQKAEAYIWELPDRKQYIKDMQNNHKAKKKQLYIFSGGVKDYYNYQQQFYDGFKRYDFINDVTVKYLESSDHTYILLEQRNKLFNIVTEWLIEHEKTSTTKY